MLKLIALLLSLWSPDWTILPRTNPGTLPAREIARASTSPLAPQQNPPTQYQPDGTLAPASTQMAVLPLAIRVLDRQASISIVSPS